MRRTTVFDAWTFDFTIHALKGVEPTTHNRAGLSALNLQLFLPSCSPTMVNPEQFGCRQIF